MERCRKHGWALVLSRMKKMLNVGSARKRTDLDVASALEAFEEAAKTDFSPETCERCLERMRLIEQACLPADSYRPPYYFWRSRLDKETRKAWSAAIRLRLDRKPLPKHQVMLIALDARLVAGGYAADALVNRRWKDHFGILTPLVAEELCLILHQQRAYPKLQVVAEHVLTNIPLHGHQLQVTCDWYFQAAYQAIKGKIYRNTLSLDDVANLEAALNLCAAKLGHDSPNMSNYRGLLACVANDLNSAVEHHCDGQQGRPYHTQFFRAAANLVPLHEMHRLASVTAADMTEGHDFFGKQDFRMRHKPDGDVTLIACDQAYYAAYVEGFADSFALNNPGGLLHIHAVGFTPDEDAIIGIEQAYDVRINVTLDPGPGAGVSVDIWKGYCAGARYIHLPRYLDRYDRVIVNDIDGIVHKSMAAVWAGHEGQVMLSTLALEPNRKGHFAFWSNIGAGAFGIEALPGHKKVARALAAYLVRRFDACLEKGDRFFFTDQVGLLLCALAFRDEVPMVQMPQIFRQSSHNAQTGRDSAKKEAQKELLGELRQKLTEAEGRQSARTE